MISALKFLWGNALLRGKFQKIAKNTNFEIFESALYIKSGSMPLIRGKLQIDAENSNFENLECPLYEITEYAFK